MFRSLSIIIPNYNGENLLKKFMPSVIDAAKHYNGELEIIIVDDRSKDNSNTILQEFAAEHSFIKIIPHGHNKGFSATCNTGIEAATGDILFFLNNDVQLAPDFFDYFNDYFDADDTFAVTVCGYNYYDKQPLDGIKLGFWKKGMPRVTKNVFKENLDSHSLKPPYLSFSVQGAYFFCDAKKTKALNGFDELFSPYLFEETDLSYRALKRNWKIYFEPRCIAFHAVSATIAKENQHKRKVINTKNKLIFVWKNIHDSRMLISHFFCLLLRIICFNSTYFDAFLMALKQLDVIKEKRKIEKEATVIRDRELFFGRFLR